MLAIHACIAYCLYMQYTIRGVPTVVDDALRKRARETGKSLNEVVIDALADGAEVTRAPRRRRDLRDLAGTWDSDAAVDEVLAAQDESDPDLWR